MDLPSLVSELQFRGFDQEKIDSSLRCLVHVYEVQSYASADGGILAEDVVDTYDLDVVQAASQLFLERSMQGGRQVFRVKWGCEDAAKVMETELWEHATERWTEFVSQINRRYLGFLMPTYDDGGRVVTDWKLSRELRWLSIEKPEQGWRLLGMVDDLTEVAWRLDLAFGYRRLGPDGISGPRVLLHAGAYKALNEIKINPPEELVKAIRLWRFFSEYDIHSTDFVALMRDCGLTLDDVNEQINRFFGLNLTSQYREGQYPPYLVNDKKKREFREAVLGLLRPMDAWLLASESIVLPTAQSPAQDSS